MNKNKSGEFNVIIYNECNKDNIKSGEFNVIIYNECNKDNIKYKSNDGILDV
jgi:hypothetical protein